jgi:hypothetical protein
MIPHIIEIDIVNINPDNELKIVHALSEFGNLDTNTFVSTAQQTCMDITWEANLVDAEHKRSYVQQVRDKIWAANGKSCPITIYVTPITTDTMTFVFKGGIGAA